MSGACKQDILGGFGRHTSTHICLLHHVLLCHACRYVACLWCVACRWHVNHGMPCHMPHTCYIFVSTMCHIYIQPVHPPPPPSPWCVHGSNHTPHSSTYSHPHAFMHLSLQVEPPPPQVEHPPMHGSSSGRLPRKTLYRRHALIVMGEIIIMHSNIARCSSHGWGCLLPSPPWPIHQIVLPCSTRMMM